MNAATKSKRKRPIAKTAVEYSRAVFSALADPAVKKHIDDAIASSKAKAAAQSPAGKLEKVMEVMTSPPALAAMEALAIFATRGVRLKK